MEENGRRSIALILNSFDEQLNHRLTGFPIREDKKNIFHGNKRYRNVIFNAIIPLLAIREP